MPYPDHDIGRGEGRRAVIQTIRKRGVSKSFSWLFEPQFGPKLRGTQAPPLDPSLSNSQLSITVEELE